MCLYFVSRAQTESAPAVLVGHAKTNIMRGRCMSVISCFFRADVEIPTYFHIDIVLVKYREQMARLPLFI